MSDESDRTLFLRKRVDQRVDLSKGRDDAPRAAGANETGHLRPDVTEVVSAPPTRMGAIPDPVSPSAPAPTAPTPTALTPTALTPMAPAPTGPPAPPTGPAPGAMPPIAVRSVDEYRNPTVHQVLPGAYSGPVPPAGPPPGHLPYGYPYPPVPPRRRNTSLVVLLTVLVVVAALVVGFAIWAMAQSSSHSKDGTGAGAGGDASRVTDCAQPPTLTATGAQVTASGLAIATQASSPCADGDVLTNSDTQITFTGSAGVLASGSFDLSTAPIGIPSSENSPRSVTFTYPRGSFYALPVSFGNAVTATVVEAGSNSSSSVPAQSAPAAAQMSRPSGASGNPDATIAQTLRQQAVADRGAILSTSNNQWVAQLSSKKVGLDADGDPYWSNQDILNEFVGFYQRFSGTRLLDSNEWTVFSSPGWWVTITTLTFPGPQAAVSWCAQQGFDRNHCFAKLISNTAPPQGSTIYLP